MTNFLPDDYKLPKPPSDYMTFEDGLNSIRILSSAITGYKYWSTSGKPIRSKTAWEELPSDIQANQQGKHVIQHFWAFVVFNYNLKKIQILELTQSTIQKAIKALVSNPKWGDPKMYDIAITRTEENGITAYNVQGDPPIELPAQEILDALNKKHINLAALYDGSDPFKK